MWLEDIQNGTALTGGASDNDSESAAWRRAAKEEHELGWFGWSELRDISRDGQKILFDEEGDGGGPNYTVFLRDTDGSPPSRIGEGIAMAISPDAKWAITKPAKGGPLSLVPTGAGEATAAHSRFRQLRAGFAGSRTASAFWPSGLRPDTARATTSLI